MSPRLLWRGGESFLGLANRSGRVIALGRLLLALFILIANLRSFEGEIEYPQATLAFGTAYLVFASVVLPLTWSNWWLEHRLKLPTHIVDMSFFLALDLATGIPVTNPFFVFFVFLVLSAAAKWGWRAALVTGAAATILFASETAFEIYVASLSGEEYLFAITRGGHLVVLTLMVSWFGLTHLSGSFARQCAFRDIAPGEDPIQRALTYFAGCLSGRWSAMVWSEPDEPWVHIAFWSEESGLRIDRAGPEDVSWIIAPELVGRTFLFDLGQQRALYPDNPRLRALEGMKAVNPELAARIPMTAGVGTPVESRAISGFIFVGGMTEMCWEDLPNAKRCAVDLGRGFDRWDAVRSSAETSAGETRLRVARDLHDSVAQILAGIGLKLRAARTTAADEAQKDRELQAIEEELVAYQRHVHGFIEELRKPPRDGDRVDLDAKLNEIADGLRRQWSIEIDVTGDHLVAIPGLLAEETAHLLREAASNAVRHGQATRLFLSAEIVDDCLRLVIQDNGTGFPKSGSFDDFTLSKEGFGPRSIIERVQRLGGTVELVSGEQGALLTLIVPLGTVS